MTRILKEIIDAACRTVATVIFAGSLVILGLVVACAWLVILLW